MPIAARVAIVCFVLYVHAVPYAGVEAQSVVLYRSPYDFDTTRDNLADAILAQGLIISNRLHVSDMLERTAAAVGVTGRVYDSAESLTFCSAAITHRMLALDPRNIVNCPFTIAVYVAAAEPDQVYLAFQRPDFVGDAVDVNRAAFELMDTIVQDAIL